MRRKVNAILLAAGYSERFIENKLLYPVKGKPMYFHTVEKVLKLHLNSTIVVTQYPVIAEQLKDSKVTVVHNENSYLGLSSSIKLGLQSDLSADGYLFVTCDMPFLQLDTLEKIVSAFEDSDKGIICAASPDLYGNPSLFSRKYLEELLRLKGDIGGKIVMKNHLDDLQKIMVRSPKELSDIDTVGDLSLL